MREIGERLASHGCFVLLPDLYYRSGPYVPMGAHVVLSDPEKRKVLTEKFFALATQANIMSVTRAFLDYLAAQPEVKPGGIGTTGHCMGVLMSLTAAAGTFPDSIVATRLITVAGSRPMIRTARTYSHRRSGRGFMLEAQSRTRPSPTT